MNRIRNSRWNRLIATIIVASLVNLYVPYSAFAYDPSKPKATPPTKAKAPESRPLTAKEMNSLTGAACENPYTAGSNKWSPQYKGVDLITGNFTTSGTDLSFEGGYGVPVNVTRSYSANNADEGPMGKGWTLSVDIRTTAGGLLKSAAAPIRSTPVNYKERPTSQDDPHIASANEPVEGVMATDASGQEETIQKDVDGILTTPPWDKNVCESEYETKLVNGATYWILTRNVLKTPEGTTYVYEKKGEYPNGTTPYNGTSTGEPSNILKITSVTDRHGNQTTYGYSADTVQFAKASGLTTENKLTSITMPNGHAINFTWTGNRITEASDNGGRIVTYEYTNSLLTGVTSPGGKTTHYGYGSTVAATGAANPGTASNILTSITAPNSLTTSIGYFVDNAEIAPYMVSLQAVKCYKIIAPNGVRTYFDYRYNGLPADSSFLSGGTKAYTGAVEERTGSQTGPLWYSLGVYARADNTVPAMVVSAGNSGTGGVGIVSPDPGNSWIRTYKAISQDLLTDVSYTGRGNYADLMAARRLDYYAQAWGTKRVTSTTAYNMFGNPLKKTISEQCLGLKGGAVLYSNPTRQTDYAYWGANKFYQQKAIRQQTGANSFRFSFTDYNDDQAAQGSKGQTYRVYDDKRTNWTDSSSTMNTLTGTAWKSVIVPADSNTYSARFEYDSKGRPLNVWKLQKTDTTPWAYVQTQTAYGADQSPWWGAPSMVTEDVGGANRVTQTLTYDWAGRATSVLDASGQQFNTLYDMDGQIQSVTKVGTPNVTVASYTYYDMNDGNLARRGQVATVTDGLSGVVQSIDYTATGGGMGQPNSVTETNGGDSYTVAYAYSDYGDRYQSDYSSGGAYTGRWRYTNYISLGAPERPSRVFQTLNKLTSAGATTSEEFHYQYDSSGRLVGSAFMQTPQTGQTGYSSSYPAQVRARAFYDYDPGGKLLNIEHYWDTWNGGSYTSAPILGNSSTYDAYKLLKNTSAFYVKTTGANTWTLERTESYAYDADLDYLTGASYNDGLPNQNVNWTYDAAGNRISDTSQPGTWTYDNLNRMTASPGATYTNDILGNRLTKNTTSHTWDAVNRMTSLGTSTYVYRADGMRVSKNVGGAVSTYRYDGQMGMQDTDSSGTTKYGLGARGIDYIEKTTGGGTGGGTTTVAFPVYDSHGNMVATLSRNGLNYPTVSNRRSFDAWGSVRLGVTTGEPTGRYCANLGHKQDDESGLVYMRARFYEPTSGRFVSEDPAIDGANWFAYCGNDPITSADPFGKDLFEINTVLMNAFNLVQNSGRGCGLTIPITDQLKLMIGRLETVISTAKLNGAALISKGEADMEASAFMGSAAEYQQQVADLEVSLGVKDHAYGAAAQIGIQVIRAMIQLVENNGYLR